MQDYLDNTEGSLVLYVHSHLQLQAMCDFVNATRLYVYHKVDDISLISMCSVHNGVKL